MRLINHYSVRYLHDGGHRRRYEYAPQPSSCGAPPLSFSSLLSVSCFTAQHGAKMAARRCRGLMMATAALVASLVASRNRCFCCDAFVSPSFRSTTATAVPARFVRHRRSAAAPADADADADNSSGMTIDAPEEATISEGSSLDVENVVIIGRCEEDNVLTCVCMSCTRGTLRPGRLLCTYIGLVQLDPCLPPPRTLVFLFLQYEVIRTSYNATAVISVCLVNIVYK